MGEGSRTQTDRARTDRATKRHISPEEQISTSTTKGREHERTREGEEGKGYLYLGGRDKDTNREQKDRSTKRYISPDRQGKKGQGNKEIYITRGTDLNNNNNKKDGGMEGQEHRQTRQGGKGQGNKEIFLTKEQISKKRRKKDAGMEGHGEKDKKERAVCIWAERQGHKQTGHKRTGQQ